MRVKKLVEKEILVISAPKHIIYTLFHHGRNVKNVSTSNFFHPFKIMTGCCPSHRGCTHLQPVSVSSVVFSLITNQTGTEVEERRASPGHHNTLTIQCICAAPGWDAAPGQKLDRHVEEVFHSAERPAPPARRPRSQLQLCGIRHVD